MELYRQPDSIIARPPDVGRDRAHLLAEDVGGIGVVQQLQLRFFFFPVRVQRIAVSLPRPVDQSTHRPSLPRQHEVLPTPRHRPHCADLDPTCRWPLLDRLPRIVWSSTLPGQRFRAGAVGLDGGRAAVPAAYAQRYDTHVRPVMPNNAVSLRSLVAVAEARASFADHRTGRNCRPTNSRLAAMTGLSVRTVQRASTALRLLGVATEVMRGRQRTRDERFASWRVGDKGRGWASVWALHDCRIQSLSPHPGGSQLQFKNLT